MNLLIFITGMVILNLNYCYATSTSTTKAPKTIPDQIHEYVYKVNHMLVQLEGNPNLSKPEREQLESYKKTLETLSKSYTEESSKQMKEAVKNKFTLLAKVIDKYLKDLEKRLPIGHTTITVPTTPSTVTPTTKGTTSTDNSTENSTGSTPSPTTQSFTLEIQKRIDEMVDKLKESPNLSKNEVEQLNSYKKMLQTLSNAYNHGSELMKKAAIKKFQDLEKKINDYLDKINERLPTPPTFQ